MIWEQYPPAYSELCSILDKVKSVYDRDKHGLFPRLLRDYEAVLRSARWGFLPRPKRRSPADIDRTGNVILGPFYTSKDWEWPHRNGEPMAPLLQLNLADVQRLSGLDLGGGLVQVWMVKSDKDYHLNDFYVRDIPAAEILRGQLSQIPDLSDPNRYSQSINWALSAEARDDSSDAQCYQVTSWKKVFTSGIYHPLSESIPPLAEFEAAQAISWVNEFERILLKFRDKWNDSSGHLLGTWHGSQILEADPVQLLYCFCRNDGFNYGFESYGLLLYEVLSTGKVK